MDAVKKFYISHLQFQPISPQIHMFHTKYMFLNHVCQNSVCYFYEKARSTIDLLVSIN